ARSPNVRGGTLVSAFDDDRRPTSAREYSDLGRFAVEHHVEHAPVDANRRRGGGAGDFDVEGFHRVALGVAELDVESAARKLDDFGNVLFPLDLDEVTHGKAAEPTSRGPARRGGSARPPTRSVTLCALGLAWVPSRGMPLLERIGPSLPSVARRAIENYLAG